MCTLKMLDKMFRFANKIVLIIAVSLFISNQLKAQHEQRDEHVADTHAEHADTEKEFNPGEFAIEHVSDSYDWHITSIGEKHFSIPLPVILYSKNPELHDGKAFHIFMSSKFHHGHSPHKGFQISHSEEFKGKIVELDAEGHEVGKPIDISITKTIAGSIISAIILIWLVFVVAGLAKRNKGKAPSGLQNLIEPVILFIRDEVAKPAIGEQKYEKFMPFLPVSYTHLRAHET